ncbi:phage baseplate assembly protein V [Exilibacterium tricleocarpae]|uniref:Phage baseplate assembly protein V n=1 Tax=Exilibacterium tricleocarpae TaxID=2591008 RepID=A0A545T5X8_9GAMM|nr:phage baseplate assembly protein V [Exilibacterium tricleocarpae]TQV72585.1 phage baseplate assembly protein V [Exilibacterium tricleocarpae]
MKEPFAPAQSDGSDPFVIMHDHMLSNVIQIGKIVKPEADDPPPPPTGAAVLVHIGGEEKGTYTRNWMPWLTARSGSDAEWWLPEVDEQVVVAAPSGNLALGVVLGTVYRGNWLRFAENNDFSKPPAAENQLPPAPQAHIHRRIYKDGSQFSYDRETHVFNCELADRTDAEAPALHIQASVSQSRGKFTLSMSGENDEEEQTCIELEAGTVKIKAPEKIILSVGKSNLVMDSDTARLKVSDNGDATELVVNKMRVDVV